MGKERIDEVICPKCRAYKYVSSMKEAKLWYKYHRNGHCDRVLSKAEVDLLYEYGSQNTRSGKDE